MLGKINSNFENLSEEDLVKHAGEWIAVLDGKIVISDKSFKTLNLLLKEKGIDHADVLMGKAPELNPVVCTMK